MAKVTNTKRTKEKQSRIVVIVPAKLKNKAKKTLRADGRSMTNLVTSALQSYLR